MHLKLQGYNQKVHHLYLQNRLDYAKRREKKIGLFKTTPSLNKNKNIICATPVHAVSRRARNSNKKFQRMNTSQTCPVRFHECLTCVDTDTCLGQIRGTGKVVMLPSVYLYSRLLAPQETCW